jgi:hypothetical protein
VNIALPSTTLQALRFKNAATALSTSNLNDYELTAGASVWVNNAGTSFTLVAPPTGLLGDFNEDDVVDAADYVVWRKNETDNNPLPNDDGLLTQVERFDLWRANFGETPGSGAGGSAPIPEPSSWLMLVMAALVGTQRWRPVTAAAPKAVAQRIMALAWAVRVSTPPPLRRPSAV